MEEAQYRLQRIRGPADVTDPVALRARRVHLLEPERRPAAVRVDQVLGAAVPVAEHGTPERHHPGATSASIVTWTVCAADGLAG